MKKATFAFLKKNLMEQDKLPPEVMSEAIIYPASKGLR